MAKARFAFMMARAFAKSDWSDWQDRNASDLLDSWSSPDLFADCHAVVDLKAQITSPDRALHMRNNATASKRLGERSVRESGVPYTILRPPLMFGPGDIKHLGLIVNLMERFPVVPIPGDGRYMRQPLYVGDLCGVIEALIARRPTGEVFDIIGHERIMFTDLLRRIRAVRNLNCFLLPLPVGIFRMALGLQKLFFGRAMFTSQQLAALTAGDDFPVTDWSDVFGVPPSGFAAMAPQIYGLEDGLRRRLLNTTARPRGPQR